MASHTTHLRLRGDIWGLHYRIPKQFALLPECIKFNRIATFSLETDSLREARRKRNSFIRRLELQVDNHYEALLPKRVEVTEGNDSEEPRHSLTIKPLDPNLIQAKRVLEQGRRLLGGKHASDNLKDVATREQDAVLALFNAKIKSSNSLGIIRLATAFS
jgi:hypothetical protein